jgi:hypothetical protein
MAKIETGLHLLVSHRQKIASKEVVDAFFYLVGHGLSLPGWRRTAVQKGFIPDFRYYLGRKLPYAFIVNENSLLFYLRKAGIEMLDARADGLSEIFEEVSNTSNGEIKVRINDMAEAKRLVQILFT